MSTYIIHTARKVKETESVELVKDCIDRGYIRSCWMGGAPKNLKWLPVKSIEIVYEDGCKVCLKPRPQENPAIH